MSLRIRLLICEDSDDDAVLTVRRLERGGVPVEPERVETAAAMAEALATRPPDLVVSDYNIPGFGAEAALALLHESGLDVPFIIVSGQISDESAVALMRAGAHDFVRKDRAARLVPAVRRELKQARARREQRAAREALRISEQRFRLFAEHAPDVLFRCRVQPEFELEYLSPAAAGLFGGPPATLLGPPQQALDLVHPDDRAALEASWRDPSAAPLTVRWRRPDGAEIWTEQRAVALRDGAGAVAAVEGILRDITDRVRADAERDRLQRQLRESERLESLGRLAGGIAHDFNNLLAVILGRAELAIADLAAAPLPPDASAPPAEHPVRAGLEVIRQLAERGGALTRRLLVFSRREPLQPRVVDVNEVVADAERVLHGALGEDVVFEVELAPAACPVLIDRAELERVLLNLVANARKAMPRGGRLTMRTALSTAAEPSSAPRVRLTVVDTGAGMSEDVAKHVFEPFFTTDAESGTGLGLSMAYGVVKGAGGEIAASSEPGVGTTIDIDLPLAPAAPRVPAPPAGRAHAGGGGESVLLVEDDPDVRDLVALMLERAGYRVSAAASPHEAAQDAVHTAAPPVDVLVTDIVMPGMSGIELLARVRVRRPRLPALLISGHTADALPGGRPLPSATALLRKPFTGAALLQALDELLTEHRARLSPPMCHRPGNGG
jgi:PAS domain S-box-containing protein